MKWCAIVAKSPTGIFMPNSEEVGLDQFYKKTDFDFELEFIKSSTIQRKFIKPIVSFHLINKIIMNYSGNVFLYRIKRKPIQPVIIFDNKMLVNIICIILDKFSCIVSVCRLDLTFK